MYSLKYPEKEVPEGGEACYVESLSRTAMGYNVNISVIGISLVQVFGFRIGEIRKLKRITPEEVPRNRE